MKTNFFKPTLIAVVILMGLNSCCKKPSVKEKMMQQGILFTELTSQQYSISAGKTTMFKATVTNACPEITYNWTVSSGVVSGNKSEITFIAPNSDAQVQVTCTVKHPGLESKTKTIFVTVQ